MRMLRRNKQTMYYSNLIGTAPVYETDDDGNIKYYEDSEGNRYQLDTGEKELYYSTPVEFNANIAMSGNSEAEAVEYGLSVADYQSVIILEKGSIPVKEGSLIWHTSPVEYEYGGEEIEVEIKGVKYKTTAPVAVSSDYMILKSSPSLNMDKYVLRATNK